MPLAPPVAAYSPWRALSTTLACTLVVAACTGSPVRPPTTVTPPSSSAASAPCPEAPRPPTVTLEPDTARPADLERAKALRAVAPPLVESAPRIAPDGRHVVYLSTADGARALYVADLTRKQPPKKISAALPPRLRRPVFSNDGASLYFTSDDRGDEAYAIFRLTLATGAIVPMTPGEKLRRDGPWLTKTGDRFFFTARGVADRGTVLFEQKIAGGGDAPGAHSAPVKLFANDSVDIAAVRDDGGQVLLVEGTKGNELFALDLPASAPPRHLYPDAGRQVTIWDVAYSADGARAFVVTDDGGERATLLAIDVRSGRVLRRYVDTKHAASKGQELRARADRVTFVVDAGTRHELCIVDAATFAPVAPTPELPAGSGVPGAMHPNSTSGFDLAADGRHAVVEWSTPASPARVHVIDTKTGAHTPLTDAPATAGAAITTTITSIASYDGLALPTLVYLPAGASGKKLPVVVQMHGGFPYASTARFDPTVALFVSEGYAVVEPNLRGSGGFGRAFELADDGVKKLDGVRDLGVVARWVAAQPWADAKRMAITGRSAGGYFTLMGLAHDPDVWRCGLALVPVYDVEDAIRNTDGDLREFMEKKEMVPLSESMLLSAISPSTYVARIRAPLFLFAGARDARATIGQNEALVRTMRERGAKLEYMRSAEGHSVSDPSMRAELFARMLGFLRANMPE